MMQRLIHGGCIAEMGKLAADGVMVDMVLCDPPYGVTECRWDIVIPIGEMWQRLLAITKPNAAIVFFGTEPFASRLRLSGGKLYRYDWTYLKTAPTGHLNAKKMPLRVTECVSVFYRKLPVYNPQMVRSQHFERTKVGGSRAARRDPLYKTGAWQPTWHDSGYRYPKNVLQCAGARGIGHYGKTRYHPTQKPVEILEYLIKTYTNAGDCVLDFAAGSMSCAIAALQTGRDYIMIEKDREYFEAGAQRVRDCVVQGVLDGKP